MWQIRTSLYLITPAALVHDHTERMTQTLGNEIEMPGPIYLYKYLFLLIKYLQACCLWSFHQVTAELSTGNFDYWMCKLWFCSLVKADPPLQLTVL